MTFTRDLGMFSSLQAVWEAYPSGGQTGDYLNVNGRIYGWDTTSQNWLVWEQPQPSARTAQTINGDLNVANNVHVGGILDAKILRGRDAFCGLYTTAGVLNSICPNPLICQWALVMIQERQAGSLALGEVYYCETDGSWTDAGYKSDVAGIINQLLAEGTARQTADQELQENIDEVAGDLSDEATARQQADSDEITNRNNAITTAIGNEVTARNTAIGEAIAAEAAARNEAIGEAIAAEADARNEAIAAKDYAVITNEEMYAVLAEE